MTTEIRENVNHGGVFIRTIAWLLVSTCENVILFKLRIECDLESNWVVRKFSVSYVYQEFISFLVSSQARNSNN